MNEEPIDTNISMTIVIISYGFAIFMTYNWYDLLVNIFAYYGLFTGISGFAATLALIGASLLWAVAILAHYELKKARNRG